MKQQRMRFKSAFIKEGKLWCVPSVMNWLFTIDLKDWSVEAVCDLGLGDELRIDAIFEHEGQAWCVADKGAVIAVYDMQTGTVERFERTGGGRQRNRDAVFFQNRIWIIPIELPGELVSFDVREKRFAVHESWERECCCHGITGINVSVCHMGETVYAALKSECRVLQFHLREETMKVQTLPWKGGLRCIFRAQDEFYLASFAQRMVFRWNDRTGNAERIDCPYKKTIRYVGGVELGDGALLTDGETVDFFDRNTGRIRPYDQLPGNLKNDFGTSPLRPLFFKKLSDGERYFLTPWMANLLLVYDRQTGKWEGHTVRIPEKIFEREYVKRKLEGHQPVNESEVPLEAYIRYIESEPDSRRQKRQPERTAGASIKDLLLKEN